jgi:hypothetical protein
MSGEGPARVMVAHLFQRSGSKELSESELANAASLDLSWFPPKEARNVVAGLVRAGLLERTEEGDLCPTFDVGKEKVPLSFRPPKNLLSSLPPPGATSDPPRQQERVREPVEQEDPVPPAQPVSRPGAPSDESALELGSLLQGLSEQTGQEVGVWVERMERVVQESGDLLSPEVALLIAAAREGQEVSTLAGRLREKLESPAASG